MSSLGMFMLSSLVCEAATSSRTLDNRVGFPFGFSKYRSIHPMHKMALPLRPNIVLRSAEALARCTHSQVAVQYAASSVEPTYKVSMPSDRPHWVCYMSSMFVVSQFVPIRHPRDCSRTSYISPAAQLGS